ncbi:LytTR family two component transcriptional regulator [Novosphingobium kunmingense]|uniref:LytTR family two component transcriptional regulator n=1 Tax=Novosphingobium kunmingense TaxID=1211806 RepID=A0A2N0H4Y7_9SPHN|nr:LytTR family DNA-binding domain-containing protein [Novosphingobium kunmingense]PKB13988.1 LytTR family two component transcriptional regulator [Novosphingobium kunmingense]
MADTAPLRTLIVDDEPLALERMQHICRTLPTLDVVGTAQDGASALHAIRQLGPDLVLLDMTMPELDGLAVARALLDGAKSPAIIFVTAHDSFAVEAFDLDAVDYVLKPVTPERLERAIARAAARRGSRAAGQGTWLTEFWVPNRSELLRIAAADVSRIDAERDYVRLHVAQKDGTARSYLMLQTVSGLEARLDPDKFIRLHRSTILRRDRIAGLRHDGLGVWSAELDDGTTVRIGRTYLAKAKAMAGR